jgi:protein-S-isoprenylcysteine O-methyltransferase Ste14
MEDVSFGVNLFACIALGICWVIFLVALLARRNPGTSGKSKREPLSWLGLILQLAAYPVLLTALRPPMSPFIGNDALLNVPIQITAIGLAIWSARLAAAAIRELGKQWSLEARVLKDHKLVTTGVYAVVRHPIYTAMLGMLVAGGLVISRWLPLVIALLMFLAGTKVRVVLEERLLANAFGEQFAEWRSAVPSIIPWPKGIQAKP